MCAVTISPKYQVVIPREIRKSMKLRPGQKVELHQEEDLIVIVPVRDIRELRGFAKGLDTTVEREEDRV